MAAQLSTKLTLDGKQHNDALKQATKEVSKYKREVAETEKQMRSWSNQCKTARGSVMTFCDALQKGNIKGVMMGANNATKLLSSSLLKLGGTFGLVTGGISLADWFGSSIKKGVELAEQAEGIRMAFERLNSGDLLDNLRRETHNTVSDVNLMKQAVKFNDFNLPIEQLGTFLAFAQQKAKDTGESIDYMVDSIVTGLGRKSLPILDNLGLSSVQIKEEMKKTGDMTTAVAAIIKEQMSKAGDYVETAADRAKKKEVELDNALEELGRTFQPLTETAGNFFHSIEIGAIKAINALRPLINQFTELGRILNQYDKLGGSNKVNRMLSYLGDGKSEKAFNTYKKQLKKFDEYEQKLNFKLAAFNGDNSAIAKGHVEKIKEEIEALHKMKAEYIKGANALHNKKEEVKDSPIPIDNKPKSSVSKTTVKVEYDADSLADLEKQLKELQEKLKNKKLAVVEVEHTKKEIADLQKKIQNKKIELGIIVVPDEGSLRDLENKLSELQEKLHNKNLPIVDIEKTKKEIDELEKKIKNKKIQLGIQVVIDPEKGSLTELENLLSKLQEKLHNKNLSLVDIEKTNKEIAELEKQIKNKKIQLGLEPAPGSVKYLQDKISDLNLKLNTTVYDSEEWHKTKKELEKLEKEEHKINLKMKFNDMSAFEKIQTGLEGFHAIDGVVSSFGNLAQAIDEGANAWEVFMSVVSVVEEVMAGINEVMEVSNFLSMLMTTTKAAEAVSTEEASTAEKEKAGTDLAAEAAATTATVANKTLEASYLDLAAAEIFAAHASIPFAGVGIAAGFISTMLSIQEATKAATLSMAAFADGGIIQGRTTIGDYNLARVNSGEMILNTRQQNNLFKMIDEGRTSSHNLAGEVSFHIAGKDLKGVLRNYEDKMKKVR